MKLIKLAVVLVALMGATHAFAQTCTYGSPDYNTPNCQIQNSDNDLRSAQELQKANDAEAQRQWQIRENRALARIAKLRETPFYAAIAVSTADLSSGWGGGYRTSEESIQHARNGCLRRSADCKIIATFFNTCAGVAFMKSSTTFDTLIVATDKDGEAALNKAWNQCEAKYGKGNCSMFNDDKPYCTGYDYGVADK